MNSALRLTVRVDAPAEHPRAEAALAACAVWLAEIERCCSRFLPESELSWLNATAGSGPQAVSADLYDMLALALAAAARTDGLFDPTLLPALCAVGYDRSFDEIGQRGVASLAPQRAVEGTVAAGAAASETRRGRWRDVRLDPDTHTVTLPVGMALDLGGIAKGWAADVLASRFLADFPAYLVDLGGDLRLRGGPEPGAAWLIGISDPRAASATTSGEDESRYTDSQYGDSHYVAGVRLAAGGIATSGDARRWWLRAGQRMHHLIDPRTGRPAEQTGERRPLAVTALALTAAEADVLAKVAFLRGYPEGLRGLARGTTSAGVMVFADGAVEATPNLEEYLHAMCPTSAR
jgi:thiamine biosynthesis lipoprotein